MQEFKLKSTLYPFQRDVIERAKGFNGRCLIALDMGLGKTLCAITYIMETNSFPAIIVCPSSLKYNWAQEFQKHYDKKVQVLSGTNPDKFGALTHDGCPVYVINYDILYAWVPILKKINPSIIVMDESQMIKTPGSRRTKACAEIAYKADKMLALSGTPMAGCPTELYTTLNMLFKGKIVSRWAFMNRYTKWYQSRFGVKIIGPKNEVELNTFLKNRCMVRYKTADVLPDLPPYIRQTIMLEMTPTQQSEYFRIQERFALWLKEHYPDRKVPRSDMSMLLTQFGYMKRQVAMWKIPAVIEQIKNFLEGDDGKLIVFGVHKNVLNPIWDTFCKKNKTNKPFIVTIDGSTPAKKRQQAVTSFQENPYTRLFLGQITAAGVGLTLTESNHSLFAELDFSPIAHEQAERRNLRIGTKASFVHYNYVLMKDTIEEHVASILFKKSRAITQIVDGKVTGSDSENGVFNLVSDLLHSHMDKFNLGN